jgi:hypothetical protein
MKKQYPKQYRALAFIAALAVPFLLSAQYDDIYYTPKKNAESEATTVSPTPATTQSNSQMSDYERYHAQKEKDMLEGRDLHANDTLSDSLQFAADNDYIDYSEYEEYEEYGDNGSSKTIINNYYLDDDSYYYRRIHRFHRPYVSYRYYNLLRSVLVRSMGLWVLRLALFTRV